MQQHETSMLADARLTEIRFMHTQHFTLMNGHLPAAHSASMTLSYGPFVRDIGYFISFRPRRWAHSGPELAVYGTPKLNNNDLYSTIHFSFFISNKIGDKTESYETVPETIRDNSIVLDKSSVFISSLMKALESHNYSDGYLKISIFLKYDANAFTDFANDEFYVGAVGGYKPISGRDLEVGAILQRITRDFTIKATDGCVSSSRCLLFLASTYIRRLIRMNPQIKEISLPYSKRVVEKALSIVLETLVDVSENGMDETCQLIELIRLLKPIHKVAIAHHIEQEARKKLREYWNTMDLSQWVHLLLFATENRCYLLTCSAVSMIADNFYGAFKSQYNERSSGEKLTIYLKLSCKNDDMPSDELSLYNRFPWLNAIEKIERHRADQFHVQRTFTLRNLSPTRCVH
ncbi:hypothetical protein Tcan_10352 [Toxocara canis]|uniref:BTB domain-containing protein n=2 Tax=Toxocara canis TaxID=6265 RepID=A0A0B2VWX7_TOXCA|nr:hypothetical protein Tcan_10352 [Toxocara canis]VDM41089.1 unnamed protein product [Toxocara canis]